jgi:hypothetical protein
MVVFFLQFFDIENLVIFSPKKKVLANLAEFTLRKKKQNLKPSLITNWA